MALSDEQLRRYARNISLAEVGIEGQRKLLNARVLVIGAGGLGSVSLSYLAAAGVGNIGIVDYDRVELSNLQRQILHETGDIGRLKVESARDRIHELNPEIDVVIYNRKIASDNASSIVERYDIVADGCDNFATRFVVNQACHTLGKTLVSAALRGWEGQLAMFKSYLGDPQPCYHCFVSASPEDERGCIDAGVLGAFAGVMGSLQALEIVKDITGAGESLTGKLMLVDGISLRTRITQLRRSPNCQCCAAKRNLL